LLQKNFIIEVVIWRMSVSVLLSIMFGISLEYIAKDLIVSK
jgi:hypothetical protein